MSYIFVAVYTVQTHYHNHKMLSIHHYLTRRLLFYSSSKLKVDMNTLVEGGRVTTLALLLNKIPAVHGKLIQYKTLLLLKFTSTSPSLHDISLRTSHLI